MFNRLYTKTLIILAVSFLFFAETSSAFWLWSPKDSTFENPKYATKDTPEEQYDWAMSFFDNKEFERSAEEFLRLTSTFRDSDYAPEAQYYAGRSYEEAGKYWFAYENYQKTVEKYPYTRRMDEIIEREFNIANIFQSKENPKVMDLELDMSLEKAVTIYRKIVETSAFGVYADKSLYKMAECYRRLRKYGEAIDAYDKLITDYPTSDLAGDAKYQLASTTYEASLDPEYDQESTDKALQKFEKISQTTAVPTLATEAEKAIGVLRGKKADSLIKVAEFYEKQGKPGSALIYYKDVAKQFPDTNAAKKAGEKIEALEKRGTKKEAKWTNAFGLLPV